MENIIFISDFEISLLNINCKNLIYKKYQQTEKFSVFYVLS